MNPVFIFLIAVVWILSAITSKKKKEEAKKRAEQKPLPVSPQKTAGPPKPAAASRQTKPAPSAAAQKGGSTGRGIDSKWPWPTAAEKAQSKAKTTQSASYAGTPRYTHVVTSTLEGGHTHTESSMTGEESCPPPQATVPKHTEAPKAPQESCGPLLNFKTNSVLQGILYAEILGKPKALQRQ